MTPCIRTFSRLLVFMLSLLIIGCESTPQHPGGTDDPIRVLFIGNSYTGGIKNSMNTSLAASPYAGTQFEYVTQGGWTLQRHLDTPETIEKIKTGNWDVVVLQEQSQTPSAPGAQGESFQAAADAFSAIIKEAGAMPMFYMTWGRRDGSADYPDYTSMQTALSDAYRSAANRNDARVIPVGEALQIIHDSNTELFKSFYVADGSHSSAKGASLITSVFFDSLFGDPLNPPDPSGNTTEEEYKAFTDAAKATSP